MSSCLLRANREVSFKRNWPSDPFDATPLIEPLSATSYKNSTFVRHGQCALWLMVDFESAFTECIFRVETTVCHRQVTGLN